MAMKIAESELRASGSQARINYEGSQESQAGKLLDQYFEIQKQLFAYFGYVEDWRILPLDDATTYYWTLSGESYGDSVTYAETEEELLSETGNYYTNEIYTQRHLSKWVYRGKDYTMIAVDTNCDGNKLLQVFLNERER